jgi:hypothetical protein
MLDVLHAAADDLRFRVRDAVPRGLARIGATRGDALVADVAPWMDGFFHAAAVLLALANEAWLTRVADHAEAARRLDEAFVLARDAARATFRYPGHKALVDALAVAPGACAARFGVPIFDLLERWAQVKEPILREAVAKNLRGARLANRFAPDIARVERALAASEPERRDPRSYVGPTRGRGKAKGRRR